MTTRSASGPCTAPGLLIRRLSWVVFLATLATAAPAQLNADFTASPMAGVNPLTVSFTDTTTGGTPVGWSWTFGDGGTSSAQNPTHIYEAAVTTSYTVSLAVFTDTSFDTEGKPDFITVDPASLVVDFGATPIQGDNPLHVAFTDMSTGAVTTAWSWTFGDGGSSSLQDPVHTYFTPGSYTVSLNASVGPQSEDLVKTDYITVDPAPLVADFSASPTQGSNPLLVEFTDASSGAQTTAWNWFFGDGGTSNQQDPTHEYAAPGSYTVTLTAFVGEQSDTVVMVDMITVDPAPLVADFEATPTSGVNPLVVEFTDTSAGATTTAWSWDFGDGSSSNQQDPTHVYTLPGLHSVSLTAFVGPVADTALKTDLIMVAPAPLVVDFNAAPTAGVRPLTVAFTDDSSGATTTAWHWNFGDGLTSTQENPTHTYVAPGNYTVTLQAYLGQQGESLTKTGFVVVEPGQFGPGRILAGTESAESVVTSDVDGDGDLDVISASFVDDRISWFENKDGAGTFGAEQLISESADGALSVFAADLDGDGDKDVLSASVNDDKIAWYENLDGQGTFGVQRLLMNQETGPQSIHAADLDGDGDQDVLATFNVTLGDKGPTINISRVAWYENTDGLGNFGPPRVIHDNSHAINSAIAADVDGDGDQDVLTATGEFGGGYVGWYENLDGLGTFSNLSIISAGFLVHSARSVFAADLDGDKDLDVLSASYFDDKIAWYENRDGDGTFGPQEIISADALRARAVFTADMDGDGDQDIVTASYAEIVWHANTDGRGSFVEQQVVALTDHNLRWAVAADVDGDTFPDVVSAVNSILCTGKGSLSWIENTDGMGTLGPPQLVSGGAGTARDAERVVAVDLDGDGALDVLSATDNGNCVQDGELAWYPNVGGADVFGPQVLIGFESAGIETLSAPDIDGDGDPDILYSTGFPYETVWRANLDGQASFGPRQLIASEAGTVVSADVDGDGHLDVITAFAPGGGVAWFENTDGLGSFGSAQTVTTDLARSIHAADFDGDGDVDLLSGTYNIDTVRWYENTDGSGTFGPASLITNSADGIWSVSSGDIDGDGDLDVLAAALLDDTITWFENRDGNGFFGPPQVISEQAIGAYRVLAKDLDGDGDQDVLTAWANGDTVAWFENKGGLGVFSAQQILTTATDSVRDVFAADLDGDGDQDVLSASQRDGKIAWYENTRFDPTWVDLGGASPGINGLPALTPTGPLSAGSTLNLALTGAPSNAPMLAWLSFSSAPLAVLGGTLHAYPPNAQYLRFSDGNGDWSQSVTWPAGIPAGQGLWLQFLVQDLSVPAQITLSNGVLGVTP